MSVGQWDNGKWYVMWRDEFGKKQYETFGADLASKKIAMAEDLRIKSEKKLGKRIPQRYSRSRLDALAQAYLSDRKVNGASERWLKELKHLLNQFWLPKLCHKSVDDLSYHDVMDFMAETYGHHAHATRNRYLGYLRAIFRFGVNHGMTTVNPLAGWRKKKEAPRMTLLTFEDLAAIRKHAAPHLKLCIDMTWYTGLRPGPKELFGMKWEQVNFEKNVIYILGKGDIAREVPMSDRFREILIKARADSTTEHIIEYQGGPINKLRRSLGTACKKAGLSYKVTMYDIRHLFATTTLSEGGDLKAVSAVLGHQSTKMTADTYYHLLYGEKLRAVNLVPTLDDGEEHSPGKVVAFKPSGKRVKSGTARG